MGVQGPRDFVVQGKEAVKNTKKIEKARMRGGVQGSRGSRGV